MFKKEITIAKVISLFGAAMTVSFCLGGCFREWIFEKKIHEMYTNGYKMVKED